MPALMADRMFKLSCDILNLTSFLNTQLKDWRRYAINGTSFAAYLVLDLCVKQERESSHSKNKFSRKSVDPF